MRKRTSQKVDVNKQKKKGECDGCKRSIAHTQKKGASRLFLPLRQTVRKKPSD